MSDQKPELVKCPGCESTSFQVHLGGPAVAVVCVHCGEAASVALRRDDATEPDQPDEDYNWAAVNAEIAQ